MHANYSIDFRGSSSEFQLAEGWPLVTGCWSLVTGRLSLGDGNQWYKVEVVRCKVWPRCQVSGKTCGAQGIRRRAQGLKYRIH